ncbi:MAG: hypothetical protein ACTS5I_00980 [Rhodanobacter sp.]
MSALPAPALPLPGEVLIDFVAHAQLMLEPSTPEATRRQIESRLLAPLPVLQALGLFELFIIRDPALRQLVQDELLPGSFGK